MPQEMGEGECLLTHVFREREGRRRKEGEKSGVDSRRQTLEAALCPPPALQHPPHRGQEPPLSPSSPGPASLCGSATETHMQVGHYKGAKHAYNTYSKAL